MSESGWKRVGLGVLLLQATLLFHGAWRVGPTYDEHFYAAAGVAYLRDGELGINREHPPLLKYMAGLPLVVAGVEYPEGSVRSRNFPVAFFYQRNADGLDRNLFLARAPFCLLTLATTLLIGWAARRRLGLPASVGAMALFGLNPAVLAHGRLVSLDAGVTPLLFAAVLAFVAALERPTWRGVLVAAVLFGLANLAKFSALILGPAFVGLAAVAALRSRSKTPLGALAGTLLGGLGVFALGYGFEAKSLNEAWGSEYFVREVAPRAVAPAELARALQGAGAAPEAAARVGAGDLGGAVGLLLEGLGSPARAEQAAVALEALAGGPGELRKGAVARILALPADRLDPLQRERTLEALTGQGAADLEGWRALFDASRHESWDRAIFYHDWMKALTAGVFGHARPIPLLTALKGLDQTLAHGGIGHGSYFRGRTLSPGRDFADGNPHPEYYAVVSAVKNPIAWLVLVMVGTVLYLGRLRGGRVSALEALALLGVPAAMFLALSMGKALLGVRYLMPIYPFLVLCAAQAFASIPRAAWALTGVALVESLWVHPHQLMYYNALVGGPGGGPAVTVVGDDWGQDARAVGEFYQRHRARIEQAGGLHYRPYSPADPAAFGLDAVRAPTAGASGIVAVHQVDYYRAPEEFGWLEDYEPFLMIGHAVRVYDTRPGPPGGAPLESWEADG